MLLHSQVVSLMLPLRYDLARIGGSWAQRQVLSITLIQAAINSRQLPLALSLIASLKVTYISTTHFCTFMVPAGSSCPPQL